MHADCVCHPRQPRRSSLKRLEGVYSPLACGPAGITDRLLSHFVCVLLHMDTLCKRTIYRNIAETAAHAQAVNTRLSFSPTWSGYKASVVGEGRLNCAQYLTNLQSDCISIATYLWHYHSLTSGCAFPSTTFYGVLEFQVNLIPLLDHLW